MSTWIQTASGLAFYPLAPRIEDIRIEDIAHALAAVNRFAGHTRVPFSVAQHSVMVSRRFTDPTLALYGLLHDASEAYIGDVPRPLKRLPEWETYRQIEAALQAAIYRKFGLDPYEPEAVRVADRRMLRTEQFYLMPKECHGEDRSDAPRYEDVVITPWSAEHAKAQFLEWFHRLNQQTNNCQHVCCVCKERAKKL